MGHVPFALPCVDQSVKATDPISTSPFRPLERLVDLEL